MVKSKLELEGTPGCHPPLVGATRGLRWTEAGAERRGPPTAEADTQLECRPCEQQGPCTEPVAARWVQAVDSAWGELLHCDIVTREPEKFPGDVAETREGCW